MSEPSKKKMMKKIVTMICIVLAVNAYGADNPPPPQVKGVFQTKFSTASGLQWAEERPGEWTAIFRWKGESLVAIFAANGLWLETLREIEREDLPDPVNAILKGSFKDWAILDMNKAETSQWGNNIYEIDLRKGAVTKQLTINAEGMIMRLR